MSNCLLLFPAGPGLLGKLPGGEALDVLECPRKIEGVFKPHGRRHLLDGAVGGGQQRTGPFDAVFQQKPLWRDLEPLHKASVQAGVAHRGVCGQALHCDGLLIVVDDVLCRHLGAVGGILSAVGLGFGGAGQEGQQAVQTRGHLQLLPYSGTVALVHVFQQAADLPAVPAPEDRFIRGKVGAGHAGGGVQAAEAYPDILPWLLTVGAVMDCRVRVD